jgi:hypothetical protein
MTEETKTQIITEEPKTPVVAKNVEITYSRDFNVLKRVNHITFHTCKRSTYQVRKFQVRIAKEHMQKLITDLPEDAQELAAPIKAALDKYATYTGWATLEFYNSDHKLKESWDYEASTLELVQYTYKGEKGLTMVLCGRLRDVQSEQLKKRMRLK